MCCRLAGWLWFVVLFLALVGVASASPEATRALVVEVSGVPEVDADRLRAAIAAELGRDALAPDDPRAAAVTERISVAVDRGDSTLVVTYRGGAEPLRRSVDLPGSPDAIERAAVLLAGNLARDEASELAAALRASQRAVPTMGAAARRPDIATDPDLPELERMGASLRELAHRERRKRLLGGVVTLALGAVGAAAFGYELASPRTSSGWGWLSGLAAPGIIGGSVALAVPGRLERLDAYFLEARQSAGSSATEVLQDVEHRWELEAADERSRRRLSAGLDLALGSLLVAGGAVFYFLQPRTSDGVLWESLFVAEGGLMTALGAFQLAVPGATEAGLEAYRRASAERRLGAQLRFGLGPSPGGATVGLMGRF